MSGLDNPRAPARPACETPLSKINLLRLGVVLEHLDAFAPKGVLAFTLHGAFGAALRHVSCVRENAASCDAGCRQRGDCAYARLLEGERERPQRWMRRQERVPHPFILAPPLAAPGPASAGDRLLFRLTLIGDAAATFPSVVTALQRMAARGLGPGRSRCRLLRVFEILPPGGQRPLFCAGRGLVAPPCPMPLASWAPPAPQDIHNLDLRFVTPLRLKSGGVLASKPCFPDLVGSISRRLTSLALFHCGLEQEPGPQSELLKAARRVETADSDFVWRDWSRYSARQKTRMKLGGVVGRMRLRGRLAPLLPLLRAGEILHAGKATTFGLGRFEIIVPAGDDRC